MSKNQQLPEIIPKAKIKIDNFGFLDPQYVSIILTRVKKKKEQYIATLLLHLETGDNETTTKAVHIELDNLGERDEVLKSALQMVVLGFNQEKILDTVLVFDKHGEQLDQFLLSKYIPADNNKVSLIKRAS